MRKQNALPEDSIRLNISGWLHELIDDPYGSILLSIIPGLGHCIRGRFKEIRIFWLAWLAALLAGIFFYGSNTGFYLLGLAIGIHAWIAVQLAFIREVTEFHKRIVAMLIIIAVLWFIYYIAGRAIFSDFVGGYTAFSVTAQNVREGDYLLGRRSLAHGTILPRGSLVISRLSSFGHGTQRTQAAMVAQIVGRENEKVTIENDAFVVNGQTLDSQKFPVPKWLQQRQITFMIPPDHYLLMAEYNVYTHGPAAITAEAIRQVCVVSAKDVEAKVFMRWMPLSRRGFIRYSE